jgi:N-acetylneuraminic acid mutarotase
VPGVIVRHAIVALSILLAIGVAVAAEPGKRTLTFEDRVKAQEAIERVYYSHQIGATKSFEQAVPRAVLEGKVRKYLDQTAALQVYWKTSVTDEMLQRELERMAHGTRMPERLLELYKALGNDPFLVKECLARATLVDRLTHNFFAFDSTLHADTRRRAEELHRQLSSGELSPSADHSYRSVVELVEGENEIDRPPRVHISTADFRTQRAELPKDVGGVSELKEERDGFGFKVVLSETPHEVGVASYVVPKTSWDAWWERARESLQPRSMSAVASDVAALPLPAKAFGVSANSEQTKLDPPAAPTLACSDGGPAGTNTITMNCGGAIDATTEQVDVVIGGPASGATTLRGLNFDVTYDPAKLEFVQAAGISPLFDPTALVLAVLANGQQGRLVVAIQQFPGVPDVVVAPGQHLVLSLTFRAVPGAVLNPTPLAFERTDATSASTALNFASSLALSYQACAADDTWENGVLDDLPTARSYHTAVWTGSLMVVWGGNSGNGNLDTGERYDPVTDSWAPTSTIGAPSARNTHTAVWTGGLMIVWGGYDVGGRVSTGGRYDPATDSWTPMSTTGAPVARIRHTAVWTGGLMVVWGGDGNDFPFYFNSGGRYNPTTDSWTPTSTTGAPTPRYVHTAVWTGSLMIVWGGGNSVSLNSGGRYDPATDTWSPSTLTGAPSPRFGHTAVWTGSRMVVWGGGEYQVVNTGARYDPATDNWTTVSALGAPEGRRYHSALWTGTRMVVWGGEVIPGNINVNTGGRYDQSSDSWIPTSTTEAPSPRNGHTVIWTGSMMIVRGGYGGGHLKTGGRYFLGASVDDDGDGYSECQGDCNDANAAVYPGAPETCDGLKNDCNSPGPGMPQSEADTDADGVRVCQADCNDSDSTVFPGAPQLCDGKNNDCSDPSWPTAPAIEGNADGDAFLICQGDCNDVDASVYPGAPQLCDGKNNNCVDPAWPIVPGDEADADGDGYRVCHSDCNDASAAVHPGAPEICNGIDDNCSGQVDEDNSGVDSDTDGLRNACDNCPLVANPTQTDSDSDHVGNACDNCINTSNPNQSDADVDGRGDACDNCLSVPNGFQDDTDSDRVGDACDICPLDFDPSQTDLNHDGEGDVCDLNDGLIFVYGTDDRNYVEWQAESGYTTWNSYRGSLAVLRATGQYTQAPGSNLLAGRDCGLSDPYSFDDAVPTPGEVDFSLVTGVVGGIESDLGTNSAGVPRANAHPCP